MKYIKTLGLLAVAAAALMVFAGTASAGSTLTSPEGTTYTGEIRATSTNWELDGAFVTIKCGHSELKAKVEKHGAVDAGGNISSMTLTECNYAPTPTIKGAIIFTPFGPIVIVYWELHFHTSVGQCTFTTPSSGTTVGTLTEGKNASWDINSAKLARTAGNFLCGSSGTMTGSYDFVTPNDLWVD